MRYFLSLLIAALGIVGTGCESLGNSESDPTFAYKFETERHRFSLRDSLEATFLNASAKTLYVREQGCTVAGIERYADSNWQEITIPVICEQPATPPLSVRPGQRVEVGLAAWMLQEADVRSGRHRLILSVGDSKDGPTRNVSTAPFRLVAE